MEVKKKKGTKRKHVTDEERGEIKGLLKLKIYTCSEIGAMVGRSADAVEDVAKRAGIPVLGQSKRSEEYKQRLACMFGDLSEKMLRSVGRVKDEDLDKISLGQRAMTAGIFADKVIALSKTKEDEQPQNISLSWVQLVQQTTPGRTKDGTAETKTPEIEDAEIVPTKSGDRDFLE